jgi:outer membrane protein OmpA-like peptidoglycan-associated protein
MSNYSQRFVSVVIVLGALSHLRADATIPAADKAGAKDNPIMKRYQGSFIVGYEYKAFDEFSAPLSKLQAVPGQKDAHNNTVFEPKQKKHMEGSYTRLVYVLPENRSPLEAVRNYREEIQQKGGNILFECHAAECGADPTRGSSGGGGNMSLSMYLYPEDRLRETPFTNASCAVTEPLAEQRYLLADLPAQSAQVSVLVYTSAAELYCKAFKGRTIAVVDIVEARAREQRMVTVKASEMASAIAGSGRVALYGIYFDFNKAEVKPESNPTLEEIGKLLHATPALKLLVVGHTDNVGSFASNMDLSQRRAAAVVAALTARYGAVRDRLTPVGVSFASPVASNGTEEGRARNRRVELVQVP